MNDAEVIVVSETPFTDGAKKYARKPDGQKSDIIFDLIIQKDKCYIATQVGRRVIA
jgi:HJR/Mrr/RecB family endonuclease